MIFAGAAGGSVSLGSILHDPGTITDPTSLRPIMIELNGVDILAQVAVDSFTKQDTYGQAVTATMTMLNPLITPTVGDLVRVLYHSSVEFAGTINRITKSTDTLAVLHYECDLIDWSQILMRRQIRRNFVNATVQTMVDSILDNELLGERITLGTIDSRVTVPLVDASQHARVFDVLRDVATATGQTFWVDFHARIQMRGTPSAWDKGASVLNVFMPDFILDESGQPIPAEGGGFLLEEEQPSLSTLSENVVLVQNTSSVLDREAYRNVQTVIVTGTPQVEGEDPLTVLVTRVNDEQIAARQAIEGGTGRYEELEEITHPTSNRQDDLFLMAGGYADLRLATAGTLRATLSCQVIGYGFRAGQIGTVHLPTFGIIGEFIVRRVSVTERGGRFLYHTIELAESTRTIRAYESWLSILGKGKIAIQLTGVSAVEHSSVTFTTPGTANWTVPAGVTIVTLTCKGGSGGGAGGIGWAPSASQNGGYGGTSGKAISAVTVEEGQELNIVVGSHGPKGFGANRTASTAGTAGAPSTVSRLGIELVRADGGGGGFVPSPVAAGGPHGAHGAAGGGSGAIVTIGGGKIGGAGGLGHPSGNPGVDGVSGDVMIEW